MHTTMRRFALKYFALACLLCLLVPCALAELPKRDLIVELRQVFEGEGAAYTVSTQPDKALIGAQQLQVRNGEKASVRHATSMPMQWVQSAAAQSATVAASGMAASQSEGGVNHGVTWMQAGQGMTVKPRWPGGRQWVTVEIEVQSASVSPRTGTELPHQLRSETVTTVTAPMGQWVTIAASGSASQRGTYGSDAAPEARRLLQIRVLAP